MSAERIAELESALQRSEARIIDLLRQVERLEQTSCACEMCALCDAVADDDGEDENGEFRRYALPEHNGIDASPVDQVLCNACAYLLADEIAAWATEMHGEEPPR